MGTPVTVSDSQILLPQPEWEMLADQARQAPSFALQLQGGLFSPLGMLGWADCSH